MSGRKKKILWIDDDIGYIEPHIEEVGRIYEVVTAHDVDDAWQKILQATKINDPFSGFIVDILLPYGESINAEDADGGLKTGIAFVEQLKATENYRSIPVVVFTIRWSADVDELTKKYGIPVIRKQDPLDELIVAVNNAFG